MKFGGKNKSVGIPTMRLCVMSSEDSTTCIT